MSPDFPNQPGMSPPPSPASRRLPLPHRIVLIAATLAVAGVALSDGSRDAVMAPADMAPPRRPTASLAAADTAPFFRESWVSPRGHTASAHSSAICVLPSGDVFAIWYGGSREGASDVALFTSRLSAGGEWAAPVTTVDRARAASELDRVVKKVGNAVIFADRGGMLWMVYVSVSMGGWSGSALNVKTSRDEGRTWTDSHRLTLNPFLNVSSLVRNKPIFTSDGRIGLPIYHEFALKFPQMLWLTPGADGRVEDYLIRNLSSETGLIQPTLVALDGDRVLMMLRDHSDGRRLHTAWSEDNGWTWSAAEASGLPNPDSAVDALRLRDGRIVLVYNHASRSRENLRLAISSDGGRTWLPGPSLEAQPHQEFSYPQLVEDRRGRIHLTYTWQRERIKHVEFNLAWLDERTGSTAAEQ